MSSDAYRDTSESSGDAEAAIATELASRIGRLRRWLLLPMCLASLATWIPAYVWLREVQLAAQSDARFGVAAHIPIWTGALALVPVGLLALASTAIYRAVRRTRLAKWKAELARHYGLSPDAVEALAAIFD